MAREEHRSRTREPPRSRRRGASSETDAGRRVVRWLLVDGDRGTIVLAMTAIVFVGFLVLGLAGAVGVADQDVVTDVFTASITGIFALVTITISINQLVLSRVIGSPEHIRERMDSVHQFRSGVEDMNTRVAVAPTEPAAFLQAVTRALRDRAARLRETYGDHHDPDLLRSVDDLVDTLIGVADDVNRHLGPDRHELFQTLSPILDNSYSNHLHTVHRIEATTDDLTDDEEDAIEALARVLEEINLTRHYFKTLYIHEELATVSRRMLVTGVLALLVSYVTILAYAGGLVSSVGGTTLLVLVSSAVAVVFVPVSVLFAYSLRLTTIAKRTTTFGTFTPEEEMP